jgi:heme A synthase
VSEQHSTRSGDPERQRRRFAHFAWMVLAYAVGVVLWGAYVRATGSGAGCGNHWPLCNGVLLPRAPETATLIEFSHRLSSGLILVLVGVLVAWAIRVFPRRHRVRTGAWLSLAFTLSEALVGAGLVLFELVADDASMARAASMAVHLVNTFVLLACLALTALWAGGTGTPRLRGQGARPWLLVGSLAGLLVLGASGAVTALGDTLFPSGSLAEALRQDFSATGELLVRLRLFHPLIAVTVGAVLVITAQVLRARQPRRPAVRGLADLLSGLVLVQLLAGLVNVSLLAPVWMQLLHLALADAVWITTVLLGGVAFETEVAGEPGPAREASPTVPHTG